MTFKYRFSKLIKALIWAGMALSVTAFALNLYFLIAGDEISSAPNRLYPILQYTLMFIVSVALFAILLSLLISSKYIIDDKYLRSNFGIIKSKFDIQKVTSVVLDRTTNKLSVFFDDDAYIVIVVKEEWYEDFVDALLKVNPKIEYSVKSKQNDIDDDKKYS